MTFAIRALVIAAVVTLLPSPAAAKWTRLETANFVFVGDASAGQIREVAEKLEQFREILARSLPGATSASPVPTIVVVFATDRSLTPVKPLFRGNPIEVAGYVQTGEDVNYIAMNGEYIGSALLTVFHEYAHLLIANTLGATPAWLSEGLAEFYEVTQSINGGKSAVIGRAPAQHIELLKNNTLIPLKELFAIDHSSQVYNEGNRRGVFYAQSWALTHYLTLGNKERATQLRRYLGALRSGVAHEQAFSEAFADAAALDRELFDYVRRFLFPGIQMNFADKIVAEAARGTTIPDVEGDIHVGDMQARVGRTDEARVRLKAITDRQPNAALAWTALGLIDARERRTTEALPLLERGAERGPDNAFVLTALGRTLITAYNEANATADENALLQRARVPLTKAVDLDANSAFASGMLGYVELALGTDLPKAVSLLERAARLAPSRDQYRMMLAQALYRQRDFDRATSLLGTLLATGRSADVRDQARRFLGVIGDARARAADPSRAPSTTTPPAPRERLTAFDGGTDAGTTPARSRYRLDLRGLQTGESRAMGQFTAIECSRDMVVLRIDGNGRAWRFAAKQLGDVDLITYRTDTPGSVSCGPVTPSVKALVTYRPRPATAERGAIDGDAVAIELVPDDFEAVGVN